MNTTGNNISPITLQKITEAIERMKVNIDNINLEKQNETAIKVELKQINYDSWTALQALEQDMTER